MPEEILHILPASEWEKAARQTEYVPPDFAAIGFIHFSTPAQVDFVIKRHFAGRTGLILLHVDPAKLSSELKYEVSEPGLPPFPHLYGPLNIDAVTGAEPLVRE